MTPEVHSLDLVPHEVRDRYIREARLIFMETAPDVSTLPPEERVRFQRKYFELYLDTPALFFLAIDQDRVLGYLAGSIQTLPFHFELNPYLKQFRSEIGSNYPAHLHMNLTAGSRGMGLGSRLIDRFTDALYKSNPTPRGLHIVTSKDAKNVGFYLKNGFVKTAEAGHLLFMGREL